MQEAKGRPGKRRKRSPADLAHAIQHVAAGAVTPPEYLNDSEFADALAVWRRHAPELTRLNALTALDRDQLAMYCVAMAGWVKCARILASEGAWYDATDTNGNACKRTHPAGRVLERHERTVLALGPKFGLNPADRYSLLKDQNAWAMAGGGLFGKPEQPVQTDAPPRAVGLLQKPAAAERLN